jgi:hypothetical protein
MCVEILITLQLPSPADAHSDVPAPIPVPDSCHRQRAWTPDGWCHVHAGSGYLTAALAKLVGPTGYVLGVELYPPLAERSVASIRAACPELPLGSSVKIAAGNVLSKGRWGVLSGVCVQVLTCGGMPQEPACSGSCLASAMRVVNREESMRCTHLSHVPDMCRGGAGSKMLAD